VALVNSSHLKPPMCLLIFNAKLFVSISTRPRQATVTLCLGSRKKPTKNVCWTQQTVKSMKKFNNKAAGRDSCNAFVSFVW